MKKENLWLVYNEEHKKKLNEVCSRYKTCLDEGKTERECVASAVAMAEKKGYRAVWSPCEGGDSQGGGQILCGKDEQVCRIFPDRKKADVRWNADSWRTH